MTMGFAFGTLAFLLSTSPTEGRAANDLRLLMSVEQPSIVAPFPARATLHFHNASPRTLWLYRRVRNGAKEGASLQVRLQPLEVTDPKAIRLAAEGAVFENAGLPRPRLVRLPPEGDTTEKVTLKLLPARAGEGKNTSVWGRYRLSVVYSAQYSNTEEVARETNAVLWQGETASNVIEIDLKPPAGEGTVSGTVVNAQGRPLADVIVTLSDQDERPADQTATGSEGRFFFDALPLGTYWVTVRRPNFDEDTTVFRHVTLTPDAPAGSIEFVLYPPEIYEPRGILHKPVLILVTDGQENPLAKVRYETLWSSGKVLDTSKGETERDGTAALELIPGRNFVTLRRKGCTKQEHRIDVAPGGGVDGFKLALECPGK